MLAIPMVNFFPLATVCTSVGGVSIKGNVLCVPVQPGIPSPLEAKQTDAKSSSAKTFILLINYLHNHQHLQLFKRVLLQSELINDNILNQS